MTTPPALALLRIPAFVAAAAGILVTTFAQAMGGTYMTLVAVERAGMSPLELSVFLTAAAAAGIVMTTLFGRLFDRRPQRWPLILSLVATIAGYGLVAIVTDTVSLVIIAATLLGLAAPAFPLLFGIGKRHLDGHDARIASSGMAALRMIASLAWAIGPALGALCFALWSYPGVYFGGAACGVLGLVIVLAAGLRPLPADPSVQSSTGHALNRVVLPAVLAMVLFHSAMFLGSTAMAIVVVRDLAGSEIDVGLLLSLCAGLEVLIMGAFVVMPARRASRGMIAIGFVLFAAYFVAPLLWPTLATLYWAQILRAVAISILSVLGMMHLQELMPTRPGAAAALFANATNVSFLVSGATAGAWAAAFGYWSIFGLCTAMAMAGIGVIALSRREPRDPSSTTVRSRS